MINYNVSILVWDKFYQILSVNHGSWQQMLREDVETGHVGGRGKEESGGNIGVANRK